MHMFRLFGMLAGAAAAALTASPASAQTDVKFALDWKFEGPSAPYFVAIDKGYYKAEGLNVRIDRGTGAANTASNVASGVYDFGWADVTTLVGFNAQNPTKELTLVYVSFQDSPLAIVSLRKAGIKTLKDLEGKTVADQPGSAAGAVINFVTKVGTPEEVKINRKFTQPQLREPMLIKGEVDAIFAFDVSSVMTLVDLGVNLGGVRASRNLKHALRDLLQGATFTMARGLPGRRARRGAARTAPKSLPAAPSEAPPAGSGEERSIRKETSS